MATQEQNKVQTTQNAPAANGSQTTEAAKPARAKRDVPTIVCSPKKEEYDEIKGAMVALMGGLNVDVAFGPFVLACALAEVRRNERIQAAVKAQQVAKAPAAK